MTSAVKAPRSRTGGAGAAAGRGGLGRSVRCGSVGRCGSGVFRRRWGRERGARRRWGRTDGGRAARSVRTQPVGGGEDPGGVGGPVAGGEPELDASRPAASKPTRCMPGRRAGADGHDLEVVRRRPGAGGRGDPARPGRGGARRPVDAWLGGATRRGTGRSRRRGPKSCDRRVDEPAEERDAEAEVRRPRRRPRPCPAQQRRRRASRSASQPVVAMTKRRTPPSSGRRDVRRHRVRPRGLDDDVGAGQVGRVVAARRAAARGRGRRRRGRRPRRRRPARAAPSPRMVICMVLVPRCVVVVRGRRIEGARDIEKPRSPSWCRGPWSLRSLEAPVRRRTRRSEPQGPCLPAGPPELLLRVTREGTAVHVRDYTHSPRFHATISARACSDAAAVIHIAGAHDAPVPRARPPRFAAAAVVRA